MLYSLMKFGAYRVNYFEQSNQPNPDAFGFYIRAELEEGQPYSFKAKHQLYVGLDLINRTLGMENLVGIYLDIDCLKNLQRPAYQQMKRDILCGYFKRILVLDSQAISGCPGSEKDLLELAGLVGELELLVWQGSRFSSQYIGVPAMAIVYW